MSIFSKRSTPRSEPEDLDSGYENPYYSVREERRPGRQTERVAEDEYYD